VLLNQVEQDVNPLRGVEVGIELLVSAVGLGEAGEDVSDAIHLGRIPRLWARPKGLGAGVLGACDGVALASRCHVDLPQKGRCRPANGGRAGKAIET
jgi:hypothetical protein